MNDALRITGRVLTMTLKILLTLAFLPLLIVTGSDPIGRA